jgi:CRISP-associated protein Cas1
MEPFRPIIDHAIIKSWNLGQVNPNDFDFSKPNLQLPWKNSKKYSQFLLAAIMEHKLDLYAYTQQYYRYIMNPTDNKFPEFKTKTR